MRIALVSVIFLVGCGDGSVEIDDSGTTPSDANGDGDTQGGTNGGGTGGTGNGTGTTGGTSGTTPVPTSPVDEASLVGLTYAVNLSSGVVVEPPGVGGLLGGMLTQEILLGVVDATDTELQLRGALADYAGDQDVCAPSIEFPVADFSMNPSFQVGPESVDLDVAGVVVSIDDLEVSGAFTADASQIVGASVAGVIDTRALVGLVGGTGDDNAICDLVGVFGVSCLPCPDGTGDFCLAVLIEQLEADQVPGVTVVEITDADVAANGACP